ncbi:MAG: asparagine synthase (glutamine-hydrolyzing) [Verrucomicrobiaceae bacterium]|nr:asparagine synthase (glutamine-hydrolyzing) [Verrucomicrobiaceae bacterium]
MCGIAGILHAGGSDKDSLRRPLDDLVLALRHRGPDDNGIWINAGGTAGLAHVRLAILDLTPAGHQPMHTADGELHIIFNGEIYNFRELRAGLEKEGVVFKTNSDTEVLLQMYRARGVSMLSELRGMFAFAIWDEKRRNCLLARDPMGIKPLYYALNGQRMVFASELRALQTAGLVGRDLDAGALIRYFQMGSVPEPQTLLADVHSLEAGHYLMWENGRVAKRCYWRVAFPEKQTQPMDPVRATDEVRSALLDSLRAHFVSDVPVGVFLSGGIDSTALVALARVEGHENLATFSIGVNDPEMDEAAIAEKTAGFFGTQHRTMHLDAALGRQIFARFLESMDQPSIDGLNTHTVSSFASEHGMKVVLSGLGGDELFAGYRSFDSVPRLHAFNRAVHCLPGAATLAGWAMERCPLSARVRRVGSLLRSEVTMKSAFRCFRSIFSLRSAQLLAARYLDCHPRNLPELYYSQVQAKEARNAVSECEITLYMRNQLLKDSDVMSMARGLELRVPFVDRVLFERIAAVPAVLRLRQGKQMLLDAVPEIPEWVRNQRKRGFMFPFEKWLEEDWKQPFADAASKVPYGRPSWYQSWAVFVLEHWLRRQ